MKNKSNLPNQEKDKYRSENTKNPSLKNSQGKRQAAQNKVNISRKKNIDMVGYRLLEDELGKQKNLMEAIINNISDGIIIVNPDRRPLLVNNEAKRLLFGDEILLKREFLKKYTVSDMEGNELLYENIPIIRALKGEVVRNFNLIIPKPEGDLFLEVNSIPVHNSNGDITMVITSLNDISYLIKTERDNKTHQEQLLKIEKEKIEALQKAMNMKDEFLSLISHEFKTPITVINSAIQAMEAICGGELSKKSKSYLNKIRQNSLRQLRLVNNLLDITRINAGHIKLNKKNHDIIYHTKAIVDSVYLYSQQKGLNLTFSSSTSKKVIGLDEEKFERILLNLLSNAMKFTSEGKRILVSVSSQKDFVYVKVKDEGIGIPKEKLSVIFERFGQVDSSLSRQAEGTGIGLSLVKKLTEALGGSISVKSKVSAGSTFIVRLPNSKINEAPEIKPLQELADNRLISTAAIEFSDIYLT